MTTLISAADALLPLRDSAGGVSLDAKAILAYLIHKSDAKSKAQLLDVLNARVSAAVVNELTSYDITNAMRQIDAFTVGGTLHLETTFIKTIGEKEYSRGSHKRCEAVTKMGAQCTRMALPESKTCKMHASKIQ